MGNFYFGSDLFSEFDRLQRQMSSLFGGFPSSIRSGAFGAFPAVNIGSTDDSVEIVAFAPGMNAAELDISIDRGLLTISGERPFDSTAIAFTCLPIISGAAAPRLPHR